MSAVVFFFRDVYDCNQAYLRLYVYSSLISWFVSSLAVKVNAFQRIDSIVPLSACPMNVSLSAIFSSNRFCHKEVGLKDAYSKEFFSCFVLVRRK